MGAIFFIFYGDSGIIFLFVFYVLLGLSGSPVLPGLLTWGELVRPTTAFLSCSTWLAYGVGDAAMSFCMGALIEQFGASVMPIVVAFAIAFGSICNITAFATYAALKRKEAKVFDTMDVNDLQQDDVESPTSPTVQI